MSKISYEYKDDLNVLSEVPDINKVTAENMNEIKNAINDNYELIKKLENTTPGEGGGGTTSNMPLGTITEWFSSDYPENFMPINGQAISRTTYADLFALIGTAYGEGNGKTTFNLPNQNAGLEDIEDQTNIPKFTYIMRVI